MTEALLRAGVLEARTPALEALWEPDHPERRVAATVVTVPRPLKEVLAAIWGAMALPRSKAPATPVQGNHDLGKAGLRLVCTPDERPTLVHLTRSDLPPVETRLSIELLARDSGCLVGLAAEGRRGEIPPPFADLCRMLVSLGAGSGARPLSAGPETIRGQGEMGRFADFLLDPSRGLPVVFLSAFTNRNGEFALEPAEISRRLVGCAHVISAPIWSDTFTLQDRLGKLGCYAGGIRIYWPSMTLKDYLEEHTLIFPANVGSETPNHIASLVQRRAVARHRELAELLERAEPERLETASPSAAEAAVPEATAAATEGGVPDVETAEVAEHPAVEDAPAVAPEVSPVDGIVETDTSRLGTAGVDAAALLALQRELAQQVEETTQERNGREALIAELRQQIHALEAQVLTLRTALAEREDPFAGVEVALPPPESFEIAVLQASEYFANELVITDRAMKAASKINSADNSHEKLWKALCDLARTVRRWRADDLPAGFGIALREVGWDPHGVSDTAAGRFTSEYHFMLDGMICRLDFSIKLSQGERVYWHEDREKKRLVINHIGAHLPDSSS